jgi:hypothetical protein
MNSGKPQGTIWAKAHWGAGALINGRAKAAAQLFCLEIGVRKKCKIIAFSQGAHRKQTFMNLRDKLRET